MKGKADALFYGGKIYTMEAPDVCKEAVVLKDGKFAYVGTKEEALAQFDCEKCIDLQGKTIAPALIEQTGMLPSAPDSGMPLPIPVGRLGQSRFAGGLSFAGGRRGDLRAGTLEGLRTPGRADRRLR